MKDFHYHLRLLKISFNTEKAVLEVESLRERLNFAWQDDEYDEMEESL